jgi:hypothetical protein
MHGEWGGGGLGKVQVVLKNSLKLFYNLCEVKVVKLNTNYPIAYYKQIKEIF